MRAVTSRQMQEIDKAAQERFSIPSITLMENAGIAAASAAGEMLASNSSKVAIFCGKGNNGGDGLVISRLLIKNNFTVTTYLLCEKERLKPDPATNLNLLKGLTSKIISLNSKDNLPSLKKLSSYDLIIDSIFGTGFRGAPDSFTAGLIGLINESKAEILSIDVPSGLDATTGKCEGACIKADQTITFGLPKTGFYKEDGPTRAGKVTVKNIGFPPSLLK